MRKKRPCRICRRWFLPDKHVGNRQKVCSRPECQRQRHRRESAEYRRRERGKDREVRLVSSIRRDGVAELERPSEGSALARLDWLRVRELVGLEQGVIIQETGRVILSGVRELVRMELAAFTGKSRQVMRSGAREQLAGRATAGYAQDGGEEPNARGPSSTGPKVRGPEMSQPP